MDDPKGEKGGRSQKREGGKKGEAVKKKLIAPLISQFLDRPKSLRKNSKLI